MNSVTLITGANGFIGKVLTDYLIVKGHHVIACVRKRDYTLKEAQTLVVEDGFDITDKDAVRRIIWKYQNLTHVVHLAALMEFNPSEETKKKMDIVNVEGTRNVLSVIDDLNSQREDKIKFIFTSSQEAIGPNNFMCDESTPCNPKNHYGTNKVQAENVVREFKNTPSMILRITGVTGKGDRYAAYEFIQTISMGLMLVYPGDCQGSSSFVYVDDVASLICSLINNNTLWSATGHETYIIGPKDVINFRESIDVICDYLGMRKPYFKCPLWLFRASVAFVSPFVNMCRSLLGYNRNSFLYSTDTVDCMDQQRSYSSTKAMTHLNYNPLTMAEAYRRSIIDHRRDGVM